MAWTQLNEPLIEACIPRSLLTRLRGVWTTGGGPDPVGAKLAMITGEIRGFIRKAKMPVGPDGTIPDSLVQDAANLFLWRMISIPGAKGLDADGQIKAAGEASLKKLQSGDFAVEEPEEEGSEVTSAPGAAVRIVREGRTPAAVDSISQT